MSPILDSSGRAGIRRRLEDYIEAMIALLDQIDGDCDFEQSWPEGMKVMALPFPMEDDEDSQDEEPNPMGRSIVTLNPYPVVPKRITMRRIA